MVRADLSLTIPDLSGRFAVVTGANSGLGTDGGAEVLTESPSGP